MVSMGSTVHSLRTIEVPLVVNPYPVVIGDGALNRLGECVAARGFGPGTRVLLVTNPEVEKHYGHRAAASLAGSGFEPRMHVVDAGEEHKTLATVAGIYDAALAHRLERGSLIVALGGGVVGDMAGFAAATWLRGLAVVQVPTTLLAMVDAAIGGKTGVNHPGGKNLIGAFHQPRLVLMDSATLATLPQREFRAGMAEVIKYGVILDATLFERLEAAAAIDGLEPIGPGLLQKILERSANAKARIVAADEREGGLRAILNYGHTLGHVVETLTGYGTYLHGEAVALGMLAAGEIAVEMGLWRAADQVRQREVIGKAGLPMRFPGLEPESVLACLKGDKKVRQGRVRFVLPTAIGAVSIRDDVDEALIRNVLARLRTGD
jgi:3-dehydroquinate synthase